MTMHDHQNLNLQDDDQVQCLIAYTVIISYFILTLILIHMNTEIKAYSYFLYYEMVNSLHSSVMLSQPSS